MCVCVCVFNYSLRHTTFSSSLFTLFTISEDECLLNVLHVICRIEAYLSVFQPAFAPALVVLLTNFGELITCRKKGEEMRHSDHKAYLRVHRPMPYLL